MKHHYESCARFHLIDQGRLQIQCFDTGVGNPAPDAVVKVIQRGENPSVVEEMITDSSGRTEQISLPAPPLEYSLEPERPQPFSTYDISVTREGFAPFIVEGVQIFSEATAIQSVNLTSLDTFEGYAQTIAIPDPVLWGDFPPKIPENLVKELPPATGFIVLPKPVVPEFIIVHDGPPSDASAPNYYMPFKDYIKNCSSCEIYATWPESSLRANILAILSFTLNRVYTEWYVNKGYNFTITSSTAYDQAFSYGRNIFQEISNIVDDIFTTYITKPDIRQPLLAQYCDGVRVTCPNWLSQWGSKALGEQGYGPLDILQYYYGREIYLSQAEKVEGVPRSFPGATLQIGSTGDYVRTIQEQLNTIANNFPAINKVSENGIFTEPTENAVKTFQKIFHIPVTGMVDFATWYSISKIYVAVTKMAELV